MDDGGLKSMGKGGKLGLMGAPHSSFLRAVPRFGTTKPVFVTLL